jgi:hypothetical protein
VHPRAALRRRDRSAAVLPASPRPGEWTTLRPAGRAASGDRAGRAAAGSVTDCTSCSATRARVGSPEASARSRAAADTVARPGRPCGERRDLCPRHALLAARIGTVAIDEYHPRNGAGLLPDDSSPLQGADSPRLQALGISGLPGAIRSEGASGAPRALSATRPDDGCAAENRPSLTRPYRRRSCRQPPGMTPARQARGTLAAAGSTSTRWARVLAAVGKGAHSRGQDSGRSGQDLFAGVGKSAGKTPATRRIGTDPGSRPG